ncbi:sulfurtransferase TusA family protein, partial [Mannheimia haemolytica]
MGEFQYSPFFFIPYFAMQYVLDLTGY